MADQPTAKVQIGDDTHEVPVDSLQLPDDYGLYGPDKAPEGYVSKQFFQEELDRRGKNLVDPQEIIADDEFFQKAAAKRGIELDGDLKPVSKIDPDKLQQIRSQVIQEEVKPREERIEALEGDLQGLRKRSLKDRIMGLAPGMGVRKERLSTSVFGEEYPEFIDRVASQAKWDDERGVHYWTDESGSPIFADNPQSGNPYAGAEKYLSILRKRDKENEYFLDQTQRGSGYQGGGAQTGFNGQSVRIRREDARDSAKYRRARQLAKEKGVEVEIVD